MVYIEPTVAEFKTFWARNFPFGTDPATQVLDSDIDRAFMETRLNLNLSCVGSQEEYTLLFMYLAAHYLVTNLRDSSGGIAGQVAWQAASKSVGSVSVSYQLPAYATSNPLYAFYSQSPYGLKYFQMIYPCLIGRVFSVPGRTHA